jgi:hypothetical protein
MRFRRRPKADPEQSHAPGIPGVPGGWSTVYAVPGTEQEFPAPREPGARLRVVPNESLLPTELGGVLGELMQDLIDEGADVGVSIEIDTSDRTRPGEMRGGASPIGGIELVLLGAAVGYSGRQLERLGDRLFDATVNWVLRHRNSQRGELPAEPVFVTLYGPNGERLRDVLVPQGEGEVPPVDRLNE